MSPLSGLTGYGGGASGLTYAGGALVNLTLGSRGVCAGGTDYLNNQWPTIDHMAYATIANTGNASDFGDLTGNRYKPTGVSNGSRVCFCAGKYYAGIDYIAVATTGDASDFGDMIGEMTAQGGASNGVRGILVAGVDHDSGNYTNVDMIQYITIGTLGNATDAGNMTVAKQGSPTGVTDGKLGVFAGGYTNQDRAEIEYVDIATTNNATGFGDLTHTQRGCGGGCYDTIRGVFPSGQDGDAGGNGQVNYIDYVTIVTPSNSTDFGDLTAAKTTSGGSNDGTYGVIWPGSSQNGNGNDTMLDIDYITIQTAGNATDFGDYTFKVTNGRGSQGT